MSSNVIPLSRRVVVIKDGTVYELAPDQIGLPAGDVFGPENAARLGLTAATVYEMLDGRRILTRLEA